MNTLHLIDTFWLGGAQALLRDFFEVKKSDRNIFVYALRKRDVNISIDHPNVYCDPSPLRFSAGRIPRLVRFIKENNIDILHCHLPHSQFTGYFLKRFYYCKIKLVFHDHSDILEPAIHVKLALRFTQYRADRVVTCSDHLVKHLEEKGRVPREKIKVIPNFILPEKFITGQGEDPKGYRAVFGVPANVPFVGFAGRFVARKGWRDFIDMAEIVSKNENSTYFIMAGTGPELDKAKNYAALKIPSGRIIFPGYTEDMPVFYKAIDVFVAPSHWEGMPLAPAEALASGTPVIAYDAPGMKYDCNDLIGIEYCEIFNYKELAAEVLKKIQTDRKVISSDLGCLSVSRFIKDIEDLYKSLY